MSSLDDSAVFFESFWPTDVAVKSIEVVPVPDVDVVEEVALLVDAVVVDVLALSCVACAPEVGFAEGPCVVLVSP